MDNIYLSCSLLHLGLSWLLHSSNYIQLDLLYTPQFHFCKNIRLNKHTLIKYIQLTQSSSLCFDTQLAVPLYHLQWQCCKHSLCWSHTGTSCCRAQCLHWHQWCCTCHDTLPSCSAGLTLLPGSLQECSGMCSHWHSFQFFCLNINESILNMYNINYSQMEYWGS